MKATRWQQFEAPRKKDCEVFHSSTLCSMRTTITDPHNGVYARVLAAMRDRELDSVNTVNLSKAGEEIVQKRYLKKSSFKKKRLFRYIFIINHNYITAAMPVAHCEMVVNELEADRVCWTERQSKR